jgi:hypothetical protein
MTTETNLNEVVHARTKTLVRWILHLQLESERVSGAQSFVHIWYPIPLSPILSLSLSPLWHLVVTGDTKRGHGDSSVVASGHPHLPLLLSLRALLLPWRSPWRARSCTSAPPELPLLLSHVFLHHCERLRSTTTWLLFIGCVFLRSWGAESFGFWLVDLGEIDQVSNGRIHFYACFHMRRPQMSCARPVLDPSSGPLIHPQEQSWRLQPWWANIIKAPNAETNRR